MVVPDLNKYMVPYVALNLCLKDLLALAQTSAWDELEAELPRYQNAVMSLPQIDWLEIPQAQRQELISLLHDTQVMQDVLIVHSQSWRDELAGILQGLHNAVKIDKAYR